MSIYSSDKCSKEELKKFKQEVINWLNERFDISKLKIKSFVCYNGDVRIYTGVHNEFVNQKSSFRKNEERRDEQGNLIGWEGTRGMHSTRIAEYILFNRDEFKDIKLAYKKNKDSNEYFFFNDLIFSKLIKLN